MNYYLGIDFGGTKVKLGLFDQEINILGTGSIPSGVQREPKLILEDVKGACLEIAAKKNLKLADIKAAGMGSPGPLDLKKGMILNTPNLPTLRYFPVRDKLSEMLGMPVTLENDANAAAWSEHVAGTAKDTPDYVFLTLGTGIGGGVICNSKLVHGSRDTGGELGHIVVYPGGRKCACGHSRDQIREFLIPRMKEMIDLAHEAGAYAFYHSDGAIRQILPDMIEAGVDIVNPLQWRCQGMEREGLKRDFGKDVVLHGGVDNQYTLAFGSVAEVRQEVRDNLAILGADGGYVLAPCHNIQPVSPPENMVAMYEEGYARGWY